MTLTDTHCHLDFDHYDGDREAVLTRAWEVGLERILNPGVDLPSSQAATRLAEAHPRVYAAVGVHPGSALSWGKTTLAALEELAASPRVVAIGEIGLDYYRDRAPRDLQRRVLREQLSLAGRLNLPVVLHTRNSSPADRACIADLIGILEEWNPGHAHPGVVHSYSGNRAEAERLLALGYFLGITGPVTFGSARDLQELVASIPLERLLIETDGPFLTPHPHRGRRNEPAYVRFVAGKIGELRGCSPALVAQATTENARALFGWGRPDVVQFCR